MARPLSLRIATKQNGIVREVNDIHIFVNQALPLLEEAREPYENSSHKRDRRYYVPSVKRTKFAKRTDNELKNIYERFTEHGLYETFLVSVVSKFEAFLAEVMKEILREYPQKVGASVQGLKPTKEVSTDVLWNSENLQSAIDELIDRHISKVFFASPTVQFAYLSEIAGIDVNDEAFPKFYELKATRDLLVHNVGIANDHYINKAGPKARAKIGEKVVVDREYFDSSVALVKRISGIIKRDAAKTFPHEKAKPNTASQPTPKNGAAEL